VTGAFLCPGVFGDYSPVINMGKSGDNFHPNMGKKKVRYYMKNRKKQVNMLQ
jgi:hypothetical protein